MAIAPMVVNPAVIQNRAQNVQAQQVQVAALAPVQAPSQIERPTALPIPQATAYQSPIQVPTAQPLDVNAASAALTGPVEIAAPVGTISGPKQVVTSGDTVGTGGPQSLGSGSSVREGIGSDRDVLGGKTGERASVSSEVGTIGGRGTGGSGTGPGGVSYEDCLARAEVKMYIERVKDRTVSRWIAPGVTGTHKVTLRFRLDPSGAASQVKVIQAGSSAVGDSAVEAMRAAAPFDQMSDRVRCLANHTLTGTFTLEDVRE
jgi:TonB family protein